MASLRAGHLLALALLVVATRGDERTFDCSLRSLALEYAAVLQPSAGREQLQLIADALNGSPEFGTYNCGVAPPAGTPSRPTRRNAVEASRAAIAAAGTTLYVDAVAGSDANPGTESSPLRSIAAGVAAARAAPPGPRALVLRAGIFYLGAVDQGAATIELGAADSHLTIAAYPGETVWVSGALPLGALPWVRANASGNVWTAPLPATSVPLGVPGLRANGTRLIRARFPNADPELGFGSGLFPTAWLPPVPQPTPVVWTETAINRTDMNNGPGVQYYTLGIGGGCAAYDPPAGFWCSNATTRFDGFSAEPRWPSGLTAGKDVLPHAPYARPQGAVVHAWRNGHWFTLQHEVGGYDGDGNLTFSGGGFQGGEGEDASAEFYIENVAEELDSPSEWFYDVTQEQLSLYWNDTNGTPPPSSGLAATQLSELFRVVGTQAAPVVNVSFVGLGFRDSAIAYFAPHGLPSGGDWALARTGALFFEGVVNVSVASCEFERLDSTAVFLSGYARGAVIADSDFSWLGESAIALWGWGRGSPVERMGPDLTNGDQPRGTLIEGCFARELGIWQKQSSFVFAAETGLSTIRNSVFFNGPRAAINFNEDSIGGSAISRNLGFNMCRESGDHGIFNSWGRLPYLHDVTPDGVPTTQKIMDNIDHNLFIANYNSMAALDHDDASAYYNSSFNVFAYSPFGLKSDFGGHDNAASHSVYAYLRDTSWFDGPAMIWSTFGDQYVGHEDSFHNNLVVMDWCTGDPCSSGNMSIGQICNASTSSALPLAAAPLPPLPTFGTNVTLQLVQSLAIGVRHCDFALYATERGIGDADDYIFTVRPALNGAAGAFSLAAKAYPENYMTVADASTRSLAFLTNPNVDDASWQLVEAPAPAWIDASAPPPPSFGVASLSRAPGLAGLLLTKSPTVTGPCVGVSGFSPPSAGDAVLAPAATAGSQAAWTFFVPPVPPPPPGIGVTDVHDNRYFLPTADVYECGLPLAEYQASCASCDPGSTAAAWPADDVILTAARAALGL